MKKEKVYDVYFFDDYMQTFDSKKDAKKFIKECVEFDKRNDNPFGANPDNYEIEEIELN